MPTRYSDLILGLICCSGLTFTCQEKSEPPNAKPNVIVILVDDMGYSDLGCYGSEIHTPNIDQLAHDGMRFTQFYNAARCCPSRAALLTGLYPHQAGMGGMVDSRITDNKSYQGWLSENSVTLAEVLGSNGYNTYMSGKWHVGEDSTHWPRQRGFNKYFGLISGANSYYEILPRRQVVSQNTRLTSLPEDFYMTAAITDSALQFLNQHDSDSKPFFLYVAYTAPHWPMHAPTEKIEKYKGTYRNGWDSIRSNRQKRQLELGVFSKPVNLSPRDETITLWEDVQDKETWDLKMSVYAAMMESVDDGIGKLVKYLKENGQLDNTVIMFLSDNGGSHEILDGRMDRDLGAAASIARETPAGQKGSYTSYGREWANASNTPFRLYKHWIHEGGISTPFIVYYPKLVEPGIIHEPAHIIDIMPTVTELSSASYPTNFKGHAIQPQEGLSLVPLLTQEEWKGHDALYWEHFGAKGMRQGNWKLVSTHEGTWELYDMVVDRTELNNLAEQFPDRVSEMERSYQQWATRMGVAQ